MTRVVIHIVLEDISDRDAIAVKEQIEEVLKEWPRFTVDVTLSKVPERPT